MGLILDRDLEDLQAVERRIGDVLQSTGVNDKRDVPAGQHATVQSRVQITEVQTGRDLRDPHGDLQDHVQNQ